jgi:transcriptional regulator with XRE-family HTH domain
VAQLIAEELTLPELRKAHNKTQTAVAKVLGLTQDQVSRLEQRSDVLTSTLRKYVESMGGRLSLVAEFPDQIRSGWWVWPSCHRSRSRRRG